MSAASVAMGTQHPWASHLRLAARLGLTAASHVISIQLTSPPRPIADGTLVGALAVVTVGTREAAQGCGCASAAAPPHAPQASPAGRCKRPGEVCHRSDSAQYGMLPRREAAIPSYHSARARMRPPPVITLRNRPVDSRFRPRIRA